jgi:hypothetical protein
LDLVMAGNPGRIDTKISNRQIRIAAVDEKICDHISFNCTGFDCA